MTTKRCGATTRKGKPCPILPAPGRTMCHVHDPDGTYQRQRRGEWDGEKSYPERRCSGCGRRASLLWECGYHVDGRREELCESCVELKVQENLAKHGG